MEEYVPSISKGYYPEDAGWAKRPDGENILLLCIPEYSYLLTIQVKSYEYAWLYNNELDAYVFCFRINNKSEQAIIFKRDHAGVLLNETFAYSPFSVAITHKDFAYLTEKDPVFMLNNIELTRHVSAGW